ncbi:MULTISPECIES: cobyric acid synthase [unclassified Synechococcus]|uniref:cobyric acid synthase n=1 Tax=unclassified Synechococcus TaxID=2626047 RepID=UPI0021A6DB8C|nr:MULTISPECIES: cobyric acid synthase [unclassified Synechococcus]MCT0214338.1 cobyric acid synthase [Synechococcus sp. CS-1326]MCT0234502.1 cobyric acid synthase [Synechococcus sp. CS-1327]
MVLGTSSGAGKSLMTAALCRVLRRRGERPLPFKGQNMSLNAWVDEGNGEMAYSQALQAWAAGLEPEVAMNPVLLKPQGDSTSEVIHLGRSVGIARAEHYYRDWFRPGWAAIRTGLSSLQASHPGGRLILEGAGSPVEVNLQSRDLTNLRLAQYLRARCLLVADIERGGVFAQVVGTLALLRPVERPLIRGILINRFRGRRELFDAGRVWLEQRTGIPVLGVMPWLDELFPPEDSLDLLERRARKPDAELEIAVLRLPSISNFSDFDPLEAEPSVRLRWVRPGEALGQPAAVILPGSKQTLRDLAALQASPMAGELQAFVAGGGHLFGICGGLQMLGRALEDPDGLEGGGMVGSMRGLGLLPLLTRFGSVKALRRRSSQALWPPPGGQDLEGFELHRGRSHCLAPQHCHPLGSERELGWWQQLEPGGSVAGTYLHGVFENGPWRRRWLNQLRRQRNLPDLGEAQPHHSRQRDALLDRLADAFEAHVNLEPLLH